MTDSNDGKMGIWMTTALVMGSIIGASVFMLPASLAPFGINAVFGWIVSACGAICIGVPLAKIARCGAGIQSAIEESFGKTVGFAVTWSFWISNCCGVAAIAIGAASAISSLVPAVGSSLGVALTATACIGVMAVVNARGPRSSGGMAIVTVLLRILPLIAVLVIVAVAAGGGAPLQALWTQPLSLSAIGTATALTLFAFTGFENVSAPVCKIRDAERTIPRSLLIALLAVAALYLSSSTAVMLLLPADRLAHSPAPFADVVGASWGKVAAMLAAVGIAISAIGCLGCNAMAGGELCYSMALKGDLPKMLARTNGAGAPILSQLLTAGLAAVLVLSNTSRSTAGLFAFAALVSTVAVLILYVVAALAMWIREKDAPTRILVVLGILFGAFAFYGSGLEASLWGVGLALAGLPVRAIARWRAGSSRAAAASPSALPE